MEKLGVCRETEEPLDVDADSCLRTYVSYRIYLSIATLHATPVYCHNPVGYLSIFSTPKTHAGQSGGRMEVP